MSGSESRELGQKGNLKQGHHESGIYAPGKNTEAGKKYAELFAKRSEGNKNIQDDLKETLNSSPEAN